MIIIVIVTTDMKGQTKIRTPVWTYNTTDTRVYGLSFGYATTERTTNVQSNGLRFELLGLGILLPLIPASPLSDSDSVHLKTMQRPYSERINGINLSPLGHGCDCKVNGLNIYGMGSVVRQVNGVTTGLVMNFSELMNGIQSSIYFNYTYRMNGLQVAFISNNNTGIFRGIQIGATNTTRDLSGIQIGLLNKTSSITGLQIGIWNVNGNRKSPLLNF